MILEDHERRRFIKYCREQEDSTIMIVGELRKLAVPDVLIQLQIEKATLYCKMANELEKTHPA